MNTQLNTPPRDTAIGDRIRTARHELRLTRQAFSQQTGMSAASLRNYELSKQIPGGEALKVFLKAGISADWLLTGEGTMLTQPASTASLVKRIIRYTKDKQPDRRLQDDTEQIYAIHHTDTEEVFTDLKEICQTENQGNLLFSSTFLNQLTDTDPDRLILLGITDDAMKPTLQPGWQVMVDQGVTHIHSGIYAVRIGGEIMCKRLEPRPGRILEVMSDNVVYSSYEINLNNVTEEEFAVVGRIIWHAGMIR